MVTEKKMEKITDWFINLFGLKKCDYCKGWFTIEELFMHEPNCNG